MPLNARNSRSVHRTTYAGITETVHLLKRDDDQRQGTVRDILLFRCRRAQISKTGETIQSDMSSDHRTVWLIPKTELDRVGVDHINVLDRIVDKKGRYWQAEAGNTITMKLMENEIRLECVRVDPPRVA